MKIITTLFIFLLVLAALVPTASAEIPELINYQGIVTDAEGNPLNEIHVLLFSIYADSSSGADDIWVERHTSVVIEDGLFNVILGSIVGFPDTLWKGDERWLGIAVDMNPEMYPRQRITSVPWALRAAVADMALGSDADWVISGNDIYCGVPGNVGIGTTTPTSALEVYGGRIRSRRVATQYMEMRDTDYTGAHVTGFSEERNKKSLTLAAYHDGTGSPNGETMVRFVVGHYASPIYAMLVKENGNVGIGTTTPTTKLEISDSGIAKARITSDSAQGSVLELKSNSTGGGTWLGKINFLYSNNGVGASIDYYAIPFFDEPGMHFKTENYTRMTIHATTGYVGIGTSAPDEMLHVSGTVKAGVLKLTSGADIAEPFDVCGLEEIRPGMVVCIDSENPGKLRIGSERYDRCVAGIISGAGELNPGMIMGQSGSVADGEHPVALTGRVYCLADASNGPIAPGDLLTSSDVPGHAMKVTDHDMAQGAVIGKAMNSLDSGRGLVLVLVSLQ